MTTSHDQLELYVMGEHDDPAAIEQALAQDEAARAVLASEARFETLLRDAAAAATFCPGCGDLVRAERCDACGAALRPGGYIVERVLVANAHGRMYAARDSNGKQVALKELAFVQSPTLSAIAAFEREAKVLRALEHASIPRFVASFEEGAGVHVRYYLAQELVTGESLDARLATHSFTEAEIIEIARQVLRVLAYLQSLSPMVIHRDIKPANLIARPDGSIAVVDFGAAHVQGTTAGSTSIGTFGYMPIEQLAGLIDATTDPYALGASLLHLLTRREPWRVLQGSSFEHANLSPALRGFLGTLVAPEPRDRFPNAAAALEALERAAKDEAPPSSRPRRGRARWLRPALPVAAAALAAAGIGAGAQAYLSSRGTPEPPPPPPAPAAVSPPAPASSMAPEAPHNVPPMVLDQYRIRYEAVTPDDATRAEIENAKLTRVVGTFKLCVDATGAVVTVNKLKSTGFEAYDRKIEAELLLRKYRPLEIDGKPGAICTAHTVVFSPE